MFQLLPFQTLKNVMLFCFFCSSDIIDDFQSALLCVGRSQMAEAEMAKMMDKYAKLLGHQNQKQKIQYINKLKDEYMQCRKVGLCVCHNKLDLQREYIGSVSATAKKTTTKTNNVLADVILSNSPEKDAHNLSKWH